MNEVEMKAAVVSSFEVGPRYEDFPTPTAAGPDDLVVDVLAAGLHPRVRSQADGSHYASGRRLPLVPGVDGVGRDAAGTLRYFVLPDSPLGSMAAQTVIDRRLSVPLAQGSDPVVLAGGMNPAMSSWVALRRRVPFAAGQNLLVLGATGSAGRLAVQVARLLGAAQVVAAGRGSGRLARLTDLGATATVSLDGGPNEVADRLGPVATEVDVVLDYLWGEPMAAAMTALVTARKDPGRPLSWVAIGSVAGPTAAVPSAALRAARLQIVGSGQGSLSTSELLGELPALAQQLRLGTLTTEVRPVPLAHVEQAWSDAARSGPRIVLTPR